MDQKPLCLYSDAPLRAGDAGLFVSHGHGQHPHRIMPLFDLIFVTAGELAIKEERQNFRVGPGQSLLLWPSRRHRGTAPYPPELTFYWLHFTLTAPPASSESRKLVVPQQTIVSRPERLEWLFRCYLDDREADRLTSLAADCFALLILEEVADQRPPATISEAEPLAVHAEAFIRTHFHHPLSASAVANEIGCHPDYLNRVFRRAYGRTLTEAIHRHRIQHARRQLLGTDLSVDAIAREAGFEEPGYFRRLFKRQEGMTPLAFRRLYARGYINTE